MAGGAVQWGPDAFRKLSGVINCYKPPGMSVKKMLDTIKLNLCRDLNALPCYKTERRSRLDPTPPPNQVVEDVLLQIPNMPVLTDHRLVLGPRYLPTDIKLHTFASLSSMSSGVQVVGIGQGCTLIQHLSAARHLKVYHVSGRFGYATDTFTPHGKILERATFHNVTKFKIDKLTSAITASYRKNVFSYAGVMDNSQEAYALASQGIPRPASPHTPPILYSIRCLHFAPPDFTLEIHAINEKDSHFFSLVNDLALELQTSAVCTKVRRLRLGPFLAEDGLLHKHWQLQHVLAALQHSRSTLTLDALAPGPSVTEAETDAGKLTAREESMLAAGKEELLEVDGAGSSCGDK